MADRKKHRPEPDDEEQRDEEQEPEQQEQPTGTTEVPRDREPRGR